MTSTTGTSVSSPPSAIRHSRGGRSPLEMNQATISGTVSFTSSEG